MDFPRIPFPEGRHYAVTWGIPDNYGGMTNALLHRSRAFVRLGGITVDILTVDARPDYPELSERMLDNGELVPGMRIVNVWDWLREYHLPARAPGRYSPGRHVFTPLRFDRALHSRFRGEIELSRTRYSDDGTTALQTDHYRLDGSLMLSDRRDCRTRGVPGGVSVVLCDEHGQPLRSWGGTWAFYRYWLDRMRGGVRSYLIVDSKVSARLMRSYRRKQAVVVHMVHGSHLAGSGDALRESRREVFENLNDFDSIVFLTSAQRNDALERFGRHPHFAVIPNSRDIAPPAPVERPRGRGVVLAALTTIKRVDHAVLAAIEANRHVHTVSLDVYGEGDQRPKIEQILRGSDNPGAVRLQGYRADAREQLGEASFLLLTSRSEGFPLVILESMAAGCIPIVYDIPFGPGEAIEHGVNGYLIEAGDHAGVARAILELQSMPADQLAAMRLSARHTAERFSDERVTSLWAQELAKAARRRAQRPRFAESARAVLGAGKRMISV